MGWAECVLYLLIGLVAFQVPCDGSYGYDVTVPKSFSFEHKTRELEDSSCDAILKVISLYEIDSHLEVVLIGDIFNKSFLDDLNERLESLSRISSFSSPLRHLHEKIIYHTTSSKTLYSSIDSILKLAEIEGSLDPTSIAKVLSDYHSRAATGTTLFILFRGNSTLANGAGKKDSTVSNPRPGYAYKSPVPGCRQFTFIAQDEAFAWIDLSADADEILPSTSHIPVLTTFAHELQSLRSDPSRAVNTLAAVIHRSGEAFYRFPLSFSHYTSDASLTSQAKLAPLSLPAKHVIILGITICVEDERKGHSLCEHDLDASVVAQGLSRLYSGASEPTVSGSARGSVVLQHSAHTFGVNDQPDIAHAVFSSIHHSSSSASTIIDSAELLFWLGSSKTIRKLVYSASTTKAASSVQVVPVFTLKMPPFAETFVDTINQRTVSADFPAPPGGWDPVTKDENDDKSRGENPSWPEVAVLSVRSVDLAEDADAKTTTSTTPPSATPATATATATALRSFPEIRCGQMPLPAGPAREVIRDELSAALKAAIWGQAPAYTHYTGSSKGLVGDFMWYTPVAMRLQDVTDVPVNTAESFADRRAGGRMYFIHQAETVLRTFVDVLTDAYSVHPPVNSSILFEIEQNRGGIARAAGGGKSGVVDVSQAAANSGFSKSGAAIKAGRNSGGGSGGGGGGGSRMLKSPGLLSEFLSHMDEAAMAFSHQDFTMAELSLLNAEAQIEKLRLRLSTILNTRSGYLTCKNPTDTALQQETSKLQQLRLMKQWMGQLWGRRATQRRGASGENSREDEIEGQGREGEVLGLSVRTLFSIIRFIVQIFLLVGFVFLGRLAGAKCRQMWIKTKNKQYL